jgi:hypothetical protein
MADENLIIRATPQECSACRIAAVPPPHGDIGFLFVAGFAAGQVDPNLAKNFVEGFCERHAYAWRMFKMADGGVLHFLGLLGG